MTNDEAAAAALDAIKVGRYDAARETCREIAENPSASEINIAGVSDSDVRMVRVTLGLRRKLSNEALLMYVISLVGEAEKKSGWLWVESPSQGLLDVVRATWDVIAPGWTSDVENRDKPVTDRNLAAKLAWSGISHHLRMVSVTVQGESL